MEKRFWCNFWDLSYVFVTALFEVSMASAGVLLYYSRLFNSDNGNNQSTINSFVFTMSIAKMAFGVSATTTQVFIFWQIRFIKNPKKMCPASIFISNINFWNKNPQRKGKYLSLIEICNIHLAITMIIELELMNILYFEKWDLLSNNSNNFSNFHLGFGIFVLQTIEILSIIYIVGYRIHKGLPHFFSWDKSNFIEIDFASNNFDKIPQVPVYDQQEFEAIRTVDRYVGTFIQQVSDEQNSMYYN